MYQCALSVSVYRCIGVSVYGCKKTFSRPQSPTLCYHCLFGEEQQLPTVVTKIAGSPLHLVAEHEPISGKHGIAAKENPQRIDIAWTWPEEVLSGTVNCGDSMDLLLFQAEQKSGESCK